MKQVFGPVPRSACRRIACALVVVAAAPLAAENLARGRPYTWSHPPNYERCTDPGDPTQLTDGKRVRNPWGWLNSGMVAWELFDGDVVSIVVDLGTTCVLDELRFWTRLFPRAEIVPPSLLVATSADGVHFRWAGAFDAASFDIEPGRVPHSMPVQVELHRPTARFVLVAALLRDAYVVTDEIEIHGVRGATSTDTAAEAPDTGLATPSAVEVFRMEDVKRIAARQRRLWALRRALPDEPVASFPDVDLRTEEAARLASRATRWSPASRRGRLGIRVQRVDPWSDSTPWSEPQPAVDETIRLSRGEWGAAAFEISCTAPGSVRLQALPSREGAPTATLREVVHVEARDNRWAGDALPLLRTSAADPAGVIELRGGEVKQVWVDLDARDASPGDHEVRIRCGEVTLPIPVRVYDVDMPATPLRVSNWTYAHSSVLLRDAPRWAVRDNVEHGVNCWWLASDTVPWPDPRDIDARGHLSRPLDFTRSDSFLVLHTMDPGMARVGWYWDFVIERDDPSRGRFRHPYMSAPWKRAVSEWLTMWSRHLQESGFGRKHVFMNPVDERAGERVAELYRFLKQVAPELDLAITLTRGQTAEEMRAMEPWIDIAILERRRLPERLEFIARHRERGGEVWLYDVPKPAKTASPVESYRMLPWLAWARGLQGCAFWAYGNARDPQGNVWDDFDGRESDFTVVYGAQGAPRPLREVFAPSKRWQAFRLGVQDVALFEAAAHRLADLRSQVLDAVSTPSRRGALRLRALEALQ
ncbi:MAG: glycoside hydrolase domain-containing protein [Candidatus Krumholzibacteriia bacterium]